MNMPAFFSIVAMIGAVVAAALLTLWTLRPTRSMRLMRCPETGAIALVEADGAGRGKAAAPRVRSCGLWPARQDCARGCLQRLDHYAPGSFVSLQALRPFEHP